MDSMETVTAKNSFVYDSSLLKKSITFVLCKLELGSNKLTKRLGDLLVQAYVLQ